MEFGFPRLFPVNLKASPVLGLKAYPSVAAIPEPVDYAILGVPLDQVQSCVEECAAKGVKTLCIYTAGFAESDAERGKEEQSYLVAIARRAGMRLLGPNCIGIHCPRSRLAFNTTASRQPGQVAFLSQSGRYCQDFLAMGELRGLHFSKLVSIGNAADINEAELLDYLGQDDETRIITAYLEGVRDGARFKDVLRSAARAKPVLLLKGGFTEAGRRAAKSHTASLAGSEEVWLGLMRQAGALPAGDLVELSDLAMTFSLIPSLKGVQVAVVGAGGGANVLASDALSRAGFKLLPFDSRVQKRLRQFIPLSGTGVSNPVDFSPQTSGDPVMTPKAVETVGSLEEINLVLVHYSLGRWASAFPERVRKFCDGIIEAHNKIQKPVAIMMETQSFPEIADLVYEIRLRWVKAGLCVFSSLTRAATCLGKRAQHLGLIEQY